MLAMVSGVVAAGMVEDHGEGAGLAGEDHRALRHRIEGDVVAAIGQVDRMQHLAGLGQDGRAIAAVALDESGGEDGVGLQASWPRPKAPSRQQSQRLRP